jgi:signal transduction histidine kinase
MKPVLASADHHGSVPENKLFSLAEKNKITILEFFDNRLAYWSSNDFDVPATYNDSLYHKPIVFLQNGWFLPGTIEAGNEKIVGLLRIRAEFSLSNDNIRTRFEKDYRMPANTGLSTDRNASEFHVYDKKGRFLFSLVFPETRENTSFILIPLLLWTGVLITLLMMLLQLVKLMASRGKVLTGIFLALTGCILIYLLFDFAKYPLTVYRTELFLPYRFTLNPFIPTLGHLLLLSFLAVYFSGIFYRYFPLSEKKEGHTPVIFLFLSSLFTAGALLIHFYHQVFCNLVLTSNISFEPYKVLELSLFSVAGFISVLFLLLLPVLFIMKVMRVIKSYRTSFVAVSIIPALLLLIILNYSHPVQMLYVLFLFLALCTAIWVTGRYKISIFNQTVIFSLIAGLYSLHVIMRLSEQKTTDNIKIQAVTFSTENDPEAEHLLLNMWPVISHDTVLAGMMKSDSFNINSDDVQDISDYLHENYFRGYWANFNFNIVLCRNDEPLRVVGQGNEIYPSCFSFFDERIRRDGQRLTGTDFFFIDNQGGRSYYICRLFYPGGENYVNGLYIELYGDVNIFQPGYSALLLDKNYHGYAGLKNYSFAKYLNGEIVLRTGDFPYNKTDASYVDKVLDYRIFKSDDYIHVLYKNGNATVVISRPVLTAGDLIISFAYLFAFILLFSNLLVLMISKPVVRGSNIFNFRQKLQLSYIAILMFSFILIGVVVAYITITQYKAKHYENIKEKLNSVYLELDNRLAGEKYLDSGWRSGNYSSLNELLIDLSNVFNTDINLYDVTGKLIATSRPEIFYRNLTGTRINNNAYNNLRDLDRSEYYQREKIGDLEYLSAYIPFFNTDNKVLAFLNLPYFRMQSVLAKEISNLIVAVINFTLLLILITMSIAVVISKRLTAPLSMLGEGLASVGIGRKTEHLSYKGHDEIGELVRQYNRMVDKIEESAQKLANSEREYAWREMAKQIAHEIKNPLTPMKLNVQQLLKAWKDKVPDFGERLEHFTKNQIEYIDNLSSIASAFSSFAKMPGANPSEVNLIDQLKITLELFKDADNITFRVQWPGESKVVVFADKEHLNGIFSNLIKNGIQSIPPGRNGIISVKVEVRKDRVMTSISDNGAGIPRELQKKLFTPNFTTKSSGMGLGLSIVRKYVETAGGSIWFESETNKGTTFFVELPLKYTVEKLG